ncbi:MAG: DUF5320 domain-containing protein [Calditrichaeota bacterium]|nr:DUF5320 domain-containing protein [Calditrichota bacterium]
MPYGDRTGPMGAGPMTGRGAGDCSGSIRPDNMIPNRGFGFRAGFGGGFGGRGRGHRNQYYATGLPGWARGGRFFRPEFDPQPTETEYSRDEEIKTLKSQSKVLENNLSALNKRIAELESSTGE